MPADVMTVLVPLLSHCHSAFQDSQDVAVPLGPYFPRRGHPLPPSAGKGIARPLRPMVQMTVPHNQLECSRVREKIKFLGQFLIQLFCRESTQNTMRRWINFSGLITNSLTCYVGWR